MDTTEFETLTLPEGPGELTTADFTVTKYQEMADDLSKALDTLLEAVPAFEQMHESSLGFVIGHHGIPDEFLSNAVTAVHENPDFQRYAAIDVTRGRNALQYMDAYRRLGEKLVARGRDLLFTVDTVKANLASEALDTYAAAKRLVRKRANAALTYHVAAMRRTLGRAGHRKKGAPKTAPGSTTSPPAAETNPPASTTVSASE